MNFDPVDCKSGMNDIYNRHLRFVLHDKLIFISSAQSNTWFGLIFFNVTDDKMSNDMSRPLGILKSDKT